MTIQSPDAFYIVFRTNYGTFTANCERNRAPAWVDRVYNLVINGYYNDNYFLRVVNVETLKIIQFGTNGIPAISNVYNWNSSILGNCSIIKPQPNHMPINVNTKGLSNVYGTISMSTSFNHSTGTTWNATAELFINTGNNSRLDSLLFIPICTISYNEMNSVVSQFPSFGELQELHGSGPSLNRLYNEGNPYIESNTEWISMGKTNQVRLN
jgi:cyclophilin family peptidyl-prolyl cis-trans isomerase